MRDFRKMMYFEILRAIYGNKKEEKHTISTDINDLFGVGYDPENL